MGKAGPRRVRSYSPEFKLRTVRLTQIEGVLVRDVAHALDVQPFMLSVISRGGFMLWVIPSAASRARET